MTQKIVKPKTIDIKEFRRLGLLQEVNRKFFHPLGLALMVIIDEERGNESLGGVLDYRDDPEGFIFADGEIEREKVQSVAEMRAGKEKVRMERFGYVIQPPPAENVHP